MFQCKGCKALETENLRLHETINRLLDKIAGPVVEKEDIETPVQRPPFERIEESDGTITERHTYGGE